MSLGVGVNPHKPAALGMAAGQKAVLRSTLPKLKLKARKMKIKPLST